ncbi:MAG: hypothetical protein M1816_000819 [Peltula sp. TS41687]|nr:MAG: hypothetical protein M1816_000819 [Peltula sp. TS41687]
MRLIDAPEVLIFEFLYLLAAPDSLRLGQDQQTALKLYYRVSRASALRSQLPALTRAGAQAVHDLHDLDVQPTTPIPRAQLGRSTQVFPRSLDAPELGARPVRPTSLLEQPRQRRPRSASIDSIRRQGLFAAPGRPEQRVPVAVTEDHGASSTSRTSTGDRQTRTFDPAEELRRATRISRHTASAILYTLEEALRGPFLFNPDLEEENAAMADLITGDVMNEAPINTRPANNGSSRAGRSGSAVPYSASGVRGPRDVMRDREAREARKRAESEARQREQQEEENRRRLQEERRRSAERRTAATSAADVDDRTSYPPQPSGQEGEPGARPAGGREKAAPVNLDKPQPEPRLTGATLRPTPSQTHHPDIPTSVQDRARVSSSDARILAAGGATGTSARLVAGEPSRTQRPAPPQAQPKPSRPQPTSAAANVNRTTSQPPQPKPVPATGQPGASAASQSGPRGVSTEGAPSRNPNVSSFPHAFERWETLSSHWEGLTSYWIRRLEQNKDEVGREPLAQQMARQITDLSAAGANLFHAVVELQRLRASSERKFQRWFFETRAEQERAQELQAELENSLRRERQQRGELLQTAARLEAEKAQADKMVAEMKRELQISKEEARRAWEELGRREQEERERATALRDGQPTVMGGIQVVPMLQTGTGRHGGDNRPPTREGPTTYGGGPEHSPVEESPVTETEGYEPHQDEYPATSLDDPFLEPPPRSAGRLSQPTAEPQPAVTNGVASAGRSRMTDLPTSLPLSSLPQITTSLSPLPQGSVAPTSFYQHQGTSLQGPGQIGVPRADNRSVLSHPSEGTVSEEEYEYDEQGRYRVDAEGRPILYHRGGAETSEGGDGGGGGGGGEYSGHYGGVSGAGYGSSSTTTTTTTTTSPLRGGVTGTGWSGGPADYSGSAYGSVWESVPRHHHPTRLSDVVEEDERSHTVPSRGSLRSGR